MALIGEIERKSNVSFHPADSAALEQLRLLGTPNDALSFFQEHEPADIAEINKVRLLPIEGILIENRDFVPGADIHPLGYVVFATTVYGDAFCFATLGKGNVQTAPIVLVAHDLEWDEAAMSEKLPELAKPIADSFHGFLEAWAAETLDIEPLYPELML